MQLSPEAQVTLQAFKSEFEEFRAQNRPLTRIPYHLRQSALAAIASGIKPSVVRRIGGISNSQLKRWQQKGARMSMRAPTNAEPTLPPSKVKPRILDVVSGSTAPGPGMPSGLRVTYEAGRLVLEISLAGVS